MSVTIIIVCVTLVSIWVIQSITHIWRTIEMLKQRIEVLEIKDKHAKFEERLIQERHEILKTEVSESEQKS